MYNNSQGVYSTGDATVQEVSNIGPGSGQKIDLARGQLTSTNNLQVECVSNNFPLFLETVSGLVDILWLGVKILLKVLFLVQAT